MGDKMKNSYIFIDFQNQSVDLKLIIDTLSKNRRIIGIKAYGHWYKHPILSLNYAKNGAELIEIPEDTFSSNKKNDIKLIVDVIETLFIKKNVDEFVIISGDLDFLPLLFKLREYSKYVTVISRRNSTSAYLINNADEYIAYDELVKSESLHLPLPGTLDKLILEIKEILNNRDVNFDFFNISRLLEGLSIEPKKYNHKSIESLTDEIISEIKGEKYYESYKTFLLRTIAKYGREGAEISQLKECLIKKDKWSPPDKISFSSFIEKLAKDNQAFYNDKKVYIKAPERWEILLKDKLPYPEYIDTFSNEFIQRCNGEKTIREILDTMIQEKTIPAKIANSFGHLSKFTGLIKGVDGSDYVSYNIPVISSSDPNRFKRALQKAIIKEILKNENLFFEDISYLSTFILNKENLKYINSLLNELTEQGDITRDKNKFLYNLKSGH